jgi:hypothetical protein
MCYNERCDGQYLQKELDRLCGISKMKRPDFGDVLETNK